MGVAGPRARLLYLPPVGANLGMLAWPGRAVLVGGQLQVCIAPSVCRWWGRVLPDTHAGDLAPGPRVRLG